jgi:DNA polymerase-3 subunit alpha
LLAPYCRREPSEERKGCMVKIEYHNDGARVELMLGDSWRVDLHDELLTGLRRWLSDDNVRVLYN